MFVSRVCQVFVKCVPCVSSVCQLSVQCMSNLSQVYQVGVKLVSVLSVCHECVNGKDLRTAVVKRSL